MGRETIDWSADCAEITEFSLGKRNEASISQ